MKSHYFTLSKRHTEQLDTTFMFSTCDDFNMEMLVYFVTKYT